MKAYQIPEEAEKAFEAYFACFDPESWELIVTEEELAKAYDHMKSIENQKNQMAEWALGIHANHVLTATALGLESARIGELAKSESKKADKMVTLVRMLIGNDVREKPAVIGNWKIGFRKGSGKTVVDDDAEIPENFKRFNENALTLIEIEARADEFFSKSLETKGEKGEYTVKFIIDDGAPDKKSIKEEVEKIEESDEYKQKVKEAQELYDKELAKAQEKWDAEKIENNEENSPFYFRPFVMPDPIPGIRVVKEDTFYVKSALATEK